MNTTIQGTIKHPACTAIATYHEALSLQLFSCTLSKEQKIRDIPYDEEGKFSIELEKEEQAVQYLVKLVYTKEEETEIIQATAKLNSCKTHELDFYFDPKRFEVLLPYLIEQLRPHLGELSLVDLDEEQVQQLVSLSKQPINNVQALRQAKLWNSDWTDLLTKISFEWEDRVQEDEEYFSRGSHQLYDLFQEEQARLSFLFALAKDGVTDWKKGISLSSRQLSKKIENALAKKWVVIAENSHRVLLDGLRFLRDAMLFQADYDDLYYDAKLLYISTLSYTQKSELLNLALDNDGIAALYEEGEIESENAAMLFKVEYLELAKLDIVLEQFPPLLFKVVQSTSTKSKGNFSSIYSWKSEDWKEQIRSLESEQRTPAKYNSSDTPIDDYAAAISHRIHKDSPATALVAMVKESKIPGKTRLQQILKEHPNYQIGTATAYSYFTTNEEEKEKVLIEERDMKRVKELSRVVKLIGGFTQAPLVSYLYKEGLTSATKIYRYGKGRLIHGFKEHGYPEKVALQIYCKAYTQYRTAVFLASQYQVYERQDALIPQALRVGVASSNISGLVNMEDLFGSMDYCNCGHCQSVLSPAAYMTDLLHWLKTDVTCPDGSTGYQPILERRPDIGELQLSCANTNTVMPYIDLDNEQLAINMQASPDYSVLQTTWKSEELLVEPEHEAVLASSYATLKTTNFPLSLPYDTEWSQSRGYLEVLGTNHSDLIAHFSLRKNAYFYNDDWAKAYLGINDSEYQILVEQTPAGTFWTDYLGLTSPTKNLGELLNALNISKELFQEIYETIFVANAPLDLVSASTPACDWNMFTIDTGLSTVQYKKLMHRFVRFLRLYKHLDMSVSQLDNIIQLFPSPKIDGPCLLELAGMIHHAKALNIAIDTLTDWFSGSTTREAELANVLNIDGREISVYLTQFAAGSFPSTSLLLLPFMESAQQFASLGVSLTDFLQIDASNTTLEQEAAQFWDDLATHINQLITNHPNTYDPASDLEKFDPASLAPVLREEIINAWVQYTQIATNTLIDLCPVDFDLDILRQINTNGTWVANAKAIVFPVFLYLKHINLYKQTFDVVDTDWQGVNSHTAMFLYNNSLSNSISAILWYKSASNVKSYYDLHYNDLFKKVDDFSQVPLSNTAVFNSLGLDSHTTFVEFSPVFDFVKTIAQDSDDLVENLKLTAEFIDLSKNLKIDFTNLKSFILDSVGFVAIGSKRNDVKAAIRGLHPSFAGWAKAITPVHNKFRVQLRDALVSYYINHNVIGIPFENSAALHAYYLLDPEMDACMKTSRIKLAISSIQLLVHRGMMGLETAFCPDEQDKKQWEWRKNYRVWEANKKVFLFPENFIEPELRGDKTPFFQELEDSLLQDEINTENSEKTIGTYLTKFNAISSLDIRAQYYDDETNVLHVFARTWVEPFEYYYRTQKADKKWTPWEKIEVDISGNHLIPIVFNRRLYLFFPLFIDMQHESIKRVIDGENRNARYLEVKMCCTKLEHGEWTPKKILKGTLLAGDYAGHGVYNNLDNKLGKGIPPTTVNIIHNPDHDLREWFGGSIMSPKHNRGEYPDQFSPHGPFKRQYTPGDTDRGNVVFDNEVFKDYTKVSLEKDAFYFWASTSDETGDLTINVCRNFHEDLRGYHLGENEIAYEDSFLINACDERVSIIPAVITESGPYDKRFLAQPYLTIPDAQQLKKGYNYEKEGGDGLFIKKNRVHRGDFFEIVRKTHGNYVLTYPHQHKDALWTNPFFYSDDRHTYFVERGREKACFSYLKPNVNEEGEQRWVLDCIKTEVQSSKFEIKNHEHPFACMLSAEFNRYGIEGLYDSTNPNIRRQLAVKDYFKIEYDPAYQYVNTNYPRVEYDFTRLGSHSDYNWELFFHIPSLIGRQLRLNGKFAESIWWLQRIFDPTNRETAQFGDLRFWKIKPFMKDVSEDSIDNMLRLLSASNLSQEEEEKRQSYLDQISAWQDNPFQPHLIASFRWRAYMLWTVYEYIETLCDWGDMLFRQDSIESINEATQLYIMAGEMLGKRPESLNKKAEPITSTFNLISNGLDAFSNVAIALEDQISPILSDACNCCQETRNGDASLPDLLFCVPNNPKTVEIWDKIADRLFKIRHCMNIEGQVRELALFQPPIDPALLVRATAMGLDIATVLADVYAPQPHYRFNYLIQKANEFTGEVKALGGALLSALEKKDGEEMSQLRSFHEQNILKTTRNIKKMSVEEAKLGLASAMHNRNLVEIRLRQVQAKEYKSSREQNAIDQTRTSEGFMYAEQAAQLYSSVVVNIPDLYGGYSPLLKVIGGEKMSQTSQAIGLGFGILGSVYRNKASMSSTYANYDRRQETWIDTEEQLTEELKQVEKTILSAEIRLAIAEKDFATHELQIKQSQEIYDYVKNKSTNLKLYTWMSNQLMKLHRSAYELAYNMAKQAESAMKKELFITDSSKYIEFGHWDSGHRGLLAGERLSLQLKELDNAYLKKDQRNFELSKSFSLKLSNPFALIDLISSKKCDVKLDASLFNMDFDGKGLSNFKIKSIAVSIPTVTGPYIATNLKIKSKLSGEEVITSTGVNDPAVFEPNFGQPKYLPFEYVKVEDGLELQLILDEKSAFDLSTIADVVFHVRYIANNSTSSTSNLPAKIENFLMSWRHDFPLDWQKKLDNPSHSAPTIDSNVHLPYALRPLSPFIDKTVGKFYSVIGEAIVELNSIPTDLSGYDDVWLVYPL